MRNQPKSSLSPRPARAAGLYRANCARFMPQKAHRIHTETSQPGTQKLHSFHTVLVLGLRPVRTFCIHKSAKLANEPLVSPQF